MSEWTPATGNCKVCNEIKYNDGSLCKDCSYVDKGLVKYLMRSEGRRRVLETLAQLLALEADLKPTFSTPPDFKSDIESCFNCWYYDSDKDKCLRHALSYDSQPAYECHCKKWKEKV